MKETRYADLPSLVDRYPVSLTSPLLVKLLNQEILRVEDAGTLPESSLLRSMRRFNYRSMLAIPMRMQSGLLGMIFCCHSTKPQTWTVKQVDIHNGIDSTLMILQSRLKGKAGESGIKITKQYGQLPTVKCYPGQLNQVFMNLLVNAIDALEESCFDISDRQPTIQIQTEQLDSGYIAIKVADNGCGMTQAQQQLF